MPYIAYFDKVEFLFFDFDQSKKIKIKYSFFFNKVKPFRDFNSVGNIEKKERKKNKMSYLPF